jgi:hypothetical protein
VRGCGCVFSMIVRVLLARDLIHFKSLAVLLGLFNSVEQINLMSVI